MGLWQAVWEKGLRDNLWVAVKNGRRGIGGKRISVAPEDIHLFRILRFLSCSIKYHRDLVLKGFTLIQQFSELFFQILNEFCIFNMEGTSIIEAY